MYRRVVILALIDRRRISVDDVRGFICSMAIVGIMHASLVLNDKRGSIDITSVFCMAQSDST
jgi:hypothetical protein